MAQIRRESRVMRWIVLSLWTISPALAAAPAPATAPATAAATSPATAPANGAATPKDAARQFALAYTNPTRQGLRAVVSGRTPAEQRAADIWADSIASQFRLQELVRSKFGNEGYAAFFGRPSRPRPTTQEMVRMIDDLFADAKVEQA